MPVERDIFCWMYSTNMNLWGWQNRRTKAIRFCVSCISLAELIVKYICEYISGLCASVAYMYGYNLAWIVRLYWALFYLYSLWAPSICGLSEIDWFWVFPRIRIERIPLSKWVTIIGTVIFDVCSVACIIIDAAAAPTTAPIMWE